MSSELKTEDMEIDSGPEVKGPGWDQGVVGMRIGGKRRLTI